MRHKMARKKEIYTMDNTNYAAKQYSGRIGAWKSLMDVFTFPSVLVSIKQVSQTHYKQTSHLHDVIQ